MGLKRSSAIRSLMSANDPKRKSPAYDWSALSCLIAVTKAASVGFVVFRVRAVREFHPMSVRLWLGAHETTA